MTTRLVLAPLHGITGRVFRHALFSVFPGLDEAVAPFIAAIPDAADARPSHYKDLVPSDPAVPRLVPQLMGNDPGSLASTMGALAALGYDEVNWNLGCPYPMVTRKKRGAGLLPHPELVEPCLDAMAGAGMRAGMAVSLKLRLGLKSPDELAALVPVLNRYPLASVTVHPRLASQMYGGLPDLDAFAAIAPGLRATLVFSGDVRQKEDLVALSSRFPFIKAWMLGRGVLMDPFLPAKIRGLGLPGSPLPALEEFHARLYDGYRNSLHGPRHLLDKMKEVWQYLARAFPDSDGLAKAVSKTKTPAEYEQVVRRLFRS